MTESQSFWSIYFICLAIHVVWACFHIRIKSGVFCPTTLAVGFIPFLNVIVACMYLLALSMLLLMIVIEKFSKLVEITEKK